MIGSIKTVAEQIRRRDNVLGDIFEEIMMQAVDSSEYEIIKDRMRGDIGVYSELDDRNEKLKNRIKNKVHDMNNKGGINLIPSDLKGKCERYCVGLVLGKWHTKKRI